MVDIIVGGRGVLELREPLIDEAAQIIGIDGREAVIGLERVYGCFEKPDKSFGKVDLRHDGSWSNGMEAL